MDKDNICMAGVLVAALNTCSDKDFDYVLKSVGEDKLSNVARRVVNFENEVSNKEVLDFLVREFLRVESLL